MAHTSSAKQIESLDTPDQHVTFIRSQWASLAAFAWDKYQSEGRGAIVVDLRNATLVEANVNVPTYYVADGSRRLAERGGWPNADIAEVIQDYDPEQDAILLFLRLDGDVFHYNVSDDLTPPKAYQAQHKKPAPHAS
jgi:hypothetical protein